MRFSCCCALLLLACRLVHAAEPSSWQDRKLADWLDSLKAAGLQIVYSSDLVSDELILAEEPGEGDSAAMLPEVLQPFGLTVVDGPGDSLLVVRAGIDGPEPVVPLADDLPVPLPEIVVTSSRHRLEYAPSGSHTYVDRELATKIPNTGEEAVRLTNRLPSTASGGISSRSHVRGGEVNEVLFLFDGLRLYEPYHMKDFQAIATIVNPSAISGMDYYSGAYPARYGDRMSGVVSMDLREPEKKMETELALSFFNASALSLGTFGDSAQGDWLLAVRRSNLDLVIDVIDPERGNPDYQDYFAHVAWDFGRRAQISANALLSHDKIKLLDADRGEQARAIYENEVAWLKWTADWTDALQSQTILSISDINNERAGSVMLPGIVSGSLDETRKFHARELRQDWRYLPSQQWMLSFGVSGKDLDARYRFESTKNVEAPFDTILGNQPTTVRNSALSPDGAQFAAYTELRWQPLDKLTMDLGLRWDQQSYTGTQEDKQYSPRVSILYRPGPSTEMRVGWGQFSQAQEVNELQVSDGLETYFPAQRAEHVVANLRHRFRTGMELDLSLYRKSFRKLRPRFENVFNSLTLVPELQFDRVEIDATTGKARGAELLLSSGSTDEDLLWWLGYSWSDVYDDTSEGRVQRSWDQTHTAKAGLSWRLGRWNFSAAAELHSGWPSTELLADTMIAADGSSQLLLATTPRNSGRYDTFHTLDARISREFRPGIGELTAFLDITNVYDRANPCCTEYSVTVGPAGVPALIAEGDNWLPLLPSLGVIWRF